MILAEAEKLFAEKGYYGLGLAELLKRCGIPKGSFYYYFPDGKIQLIQEVLRNSYQRMKNSILRRMAEQPTALACFEQMADHMAERCCQRPLASLLLTMLSIESVYLDERVHRTCREIYDDWQGLYASYLLEKGYPPEQSREKAQAIFALIHGSIISSWIKQNPADIRLARQTLRVILEKTELEKTEKEEPDETDYQKGRTT